MIARDVVGPDDHLAAVALPRGTRRFGSGTVGRLDERGRVQTTFRYRDGSFDKTISIPRLIHTRTSEYRAEYRTGSAA